MLNSNSEHVSWHRRVGAWLSVAGLVAASMATFAGAAAANPNNGYIAALFAEPGYTPQPTDPTSPNPIPEDCNGVAPATSSGKDSPTNPLTDKELNTGQGQVTGVTNSMLPGGKVHWIVTFPDTGGTSSFDIRDCVVVFNRDNTAGILSVMAHENDGLGEVDPQPGEEPIVKSYNSVIDNGQFEWADGSHLNGEFDLGWTIPATAEPGSVVCDYVKTTGGGSAGKGGDRKAGGGCFVVQKFSPSLTTTQVASQGLGGAISDVAHLTGGSPTPLSGDILFSLFGPNDNSCSGNAVYTKDVVVTGAGDYGSGSFTPAQPGTYQWTSHYSGDVNNKPADSRCGSEPVHIIPPDLSVSKTGPGAVAAGNNITYTVTVTNTGLGDATTVVMNDTVPTSTTFVSVTAPAGASCPTQPSLGGTGPISCTIDSLPHGTSATFTVVVNVAADVADQTLIENTACATNAEVTPDDNDCSEVDTTVTHQEQTSPDLFLQKQGPTTVAAGGTISYTVTAYNTGNGDATSVVGHDTVPANTTFVSVTPPGGASCPTQPSVGGTGAIDCTIATLAHGTSAAFTIVVKVSGTVEDQTVINNTACATDEGVAVDDDDCSTVQTTVNRPAISTTPSAGVTVGSKIHDTASVTGGLSPTGTVTFKLFAPADLTCDGPAVFIDTEALGEPSADYVTTTVGTYRWTARYNGDANNSPATSGCQEELVTTTKAVGTIATVAAGANLVVGTPGLVGDSASFLGAFHPTGVVVFTLYNSDCSQSTGITGSGPIGNSGTASFSTAWTPAAAGTYSWIATYSGDANNAAFVSGCHAADEQVTVSSTPAGGTQPGGTGQVQGANIRVPNTGSSDFARELVLAYLAVLAGLALLVGEALVTRLREQE